ncbi:hypothetical protein [Georgenia sp. SUBG003]|uniref:hypothetical protein n=1 Tax=Georgenia sp. SUBG003 TaxID=1497974 RepID=UPI003AB1C822
MSTPPARPKISEVVAGSRPRCSPHSGRTVCRAPRTAPTSSTAAPSVVKTRRCSRSTWVMRGPAASRRRATRAAEGCAVVTAVEVLRAGRTGLHADTDDDRGEGHAGGAERERALLAQASPLRALAT